MNNEQEPTKDVNKLAEEKYPVDYKPDGRTLAGGRYDTDANYAERMAFIAGFTAASNKTAAMKWVKGSERLPGDDYKKYFIRWKHSTTKEDKWEILFASKSAMVNPEYFQIEWLDESTPASDAVDWVSKAAFMNWVNAVLLIRKVKDFNEGNWEYNFSNLEDYDRSNASFDAWQKIKEQIDRFLNELPPEFSRQQKSQLSKP